jgi:hypothetical protein
VPPRFTGRIIQYRDDQSTWGIVPRSREFMRASNGLKDRENFREIHLEPMLATSWLECTIPEKPTRETA